MNRSNSDVLRQPRVALLEFLWFQWPLAALRLVSAITDELFRLDGFEDQFADMVKRRASNCKPTMPTCCRTSNSSCFSGRRQQHPATTGETNGLDT